jgi:hypothetical protein
MFELKLHFVRKLIPKCIFTFILFLGLYLKNRDLNLEISRSRSVKFRNIKISTSKNPWIFHRSVRMALQRGGTSKIIQCQLLQNSLHFLTWHCLFIIFITDNGSTVRFEFWFFRNMSYEYFHCWLHILFYLLGQFDDSVLPLVMILLEKSGLPFVSRGNPILVSRALSKMVNKGDNSHPFPLCFSVRQWDDTNRTEELFFKTTCKRKWRLEASVAIAFDLLIFRLIQMMTMG